MKPNELMIGDWVLMDMNYSEEDPMHTSTNYQSYQIKNGEDISLACETNCIGDAGVYQPIPITPEILKKNGFKLNYDGWLWCGDKEPQNYVFVYVFVQFRHNGEVRLVEINHVNEASVSFRNIQNIHELQHVLRLCKIDKLITI